MIPTVHKNFLEKTVQKLKDDPRVLGLLGAGSLITNNTDEFSDLDLVIVIKNEEYEEVFSERFEITKNIGRLLSSFTGEHVGEPRLLICLYSEPLIHVDLKFISLKDLEKRVENPVIIFERDEQIKALIEQTEEEHPMPNPQWIEDRFWTWIHYATLKLGRGEYFEIINFMAYLREYVFGPLILVEKNELPRGVRRIEFKAPDYVDDLVKTMPEHNKKSCSSAIEAAVKLYLRIKDNYNFQIKHRDDVKSEVLKYFEKISKL